MNIIKLLSFKNKLILVSIIMLSLFTLTGLVTEISHAASSEEACRALDTFKGEVSGDADSCTSDTSAAESFVEKGIQILYTIVGFSSVLMLIVSGIMFIVSGGDAEGVKRARNTALYSLVGLAVAFCAFLIAQFAIDAASGELDSGTDPSI